MYYQCPRCGYKQKSEAEDRIRCHRCGRSYKRRDAKTTEKEPDAEAGTGFFRYRSSGDDD